MLAQHGCEGWYGRVCKQGAPGDMVSLLCALRLDPTAQR